MNSVTISGNVHGNVTYISLKDGTNLAKFTLKINEAKNGKSYINVATWGSAAEMARETLKDGAYVNIVGKLSPKTETRDGTMRNYYEVIAFQITQVLPDESLTSIAEYPIFTEIVNT